MKNFTTWKLTIKPNSKKGYNAHAFCKKNSLLGVGWSNAYTNEKPTDISTCKSLIKAQYKKWPYQLKHLLESVKEGDHLWIHKNGEYILCIAEKEILYGSDICKEYLNYDLGHARKATWITVPEKLVTGKIQRGSIAQRMIQKINISENEKKYSLFIANKLSKNRNWLPNIDDKLLQKKIIKLDIYEIFSVMSPDDLEDIVAMYLQDNGWYILKSTCFRSKPWYEFSMINRFNETCYIQVKSGDLDKLPPIKYEKHVAPHTVIYLFSAHKDAYPGDSISGVVTIKHEDLRSWLMCNLWALASPIKMKLAIFCGVNA